jgi:hypothetical protein
VLGSGSATSGAVGSLGDAPLALRQVAAPPELVDRVLPDYPAQARAAHVEGQVCSRWSSIATDGSRTTSSMT